MLFSFFLGLLLSLAISSPGSIRLDRQQPVQQEYYNAPQELQQQYFQQPDPVQQLGNLYPQADQNISPFGTLAVEDSSDLSATHHFEPTPSDIKPASTPSSIKPGQHFQMKTLKLIVEEVVEPANETQMDVKVSEMFPESSGSSSNNKKLNMYVNIPIPVDADGKPTKKITEMEVEMSFRPRADAVADPNNMETLYAVKELKFEVEFDDVDSAHQAHQQTTPSQPVSFFQVSGTPSEPTEPLEHEKEEQISEEKLESEMTQFEQAAGWSRQKLEHSLKAIQDALASILPAHKKALLQQEQQLKQQQHKHHKKHRASLSLSDLNLQGSRNSSLILNLSKKTGDKKVAVMKAGRNIVNILNSRITVTTGGQMSRKLKYQALRLLKAIYTQVVLTRRDLLLHQQQVQQRFNRAEALAQAYWRKLQQHKQQQKPHVRLLPLPVLLKRVRLILPRSLVGAAPLHLKPGLRLPLRKRRLQRRRRLRKPASPLCPKPAKKQFPFGLGQAQVFEAEPELMNVYNGNYDYSSNYAGMMSNYDMTTSYNAPSSNSMSAFYMPYVDSPALVGNNNVEPVEPAPTRSFRRRSPFEEAEDRFYAMQLNEEENEWDM